MCNASMFLVILFCLPETLYIRDGENCPTMTLSSEVRHSYTGKDGRDCRGEEISANHSDLRKHIERLRFKGRFGGRKLKATDFVLPVAKMMRYVS